AATTRFNQMGGREPGTKKHESGASDDLKKAAIQNYSAITYATYLDALYTAQQMRIKINDFVDNPTEATLLDAQNAWLAARLPYGQTEFARFYNGPIDNDATGVEGLFNSWPIDENFIDYTSDNGVITYGGIINDTTNFPTITESIIDSMNTNGGETNISCGYHAVEFLLWGQDLSTTYAGQRPYTDYTTAQNAARRGQYLKACADLIVKHLQWVTDQWDPYSTSNYRATFESGDANTALTDILQGMGALAYGELSGERMEVAYESQLQEDEHDCFSDNTTNTLRMDALGIKNAFNGTYTRIDGTVISGTSIYDVIKATDAATADATKTAIENGTNAIYQIQPPFDQQILSSNTAGREIVHQAIVAEQNAGTQIAAAASKLGLTITISE
ncbi:MAG TPA: imelysin family protein, partial [Chitinophagales bacterium]